MSKEPGELITGNQMQVGRIVEKNKVMISSWTLVKNGGVRGENKPVQENVRGKELWNQ